MRPLLRVDYYNGEMKKVTGIAPCHSNWGGAFKTECPEKRCVDISLCYFCLARKKRAWDDLIFL
jgi:hypothetical protein